MTTRLIRRQALAQAQGLVVDESGVASRGIAALIRQPLSRWGLSPRRLVLRFVRDHLDALGVSGRIGSDAVDAALEQLQAFGECQSVIVSGERYLAPAAPRWISASQSGGVLLSVASPPAGILILPARSQQDVLRRIQVADDGDLATLQLGGVRTCSLDEWARPLEYIRHASRRLGRPVRDDQCSLRTFWELLVSQLGSLGYPLSGEAVVRVVTGTPGGFFGAYQAPQCVGRWSTEVEDGVWCGYRRGYSDTHWHPILVEMHRGQRRSLDLYDTDEWQWALIARGRFMGRDEQMERAAGSVDVTYPLPKQLRAAMDLMGHRTAAWSWVIDPNAPDVRSLLL